MHEDKRESLKTIQLCPDDNYYQRENPSKILQLSLVQLKLMSLFKNLTTIKKHHIHSSTSTFKTIKNCALKTFSQSLHLNFLL